MDIYLNFIFKSFQILRKLYNLHSYSLVQDSSLVGGIPTSMWYTRESISRWAEPYVQLLFHAGRLKVLHRPSEDMPVIVIGKVKCNQCL